MRYPPMSQSKGASSRWKLSTDGTATRMKWIWNLSIIMWVTRVNWIQYEVCTYIIESTNFYWEILSRWISREAFPLRGKIYTRRQCNSFCAPRTLCITVDLFKKSSTADIFANKQNIVTREDSCTVSIYRYTSFRVFLRNHCRGYFETAIWFKFCTLLIKIKY